MAEQIWNPAAPAWRITTINLDDYEKLLSIVVVVQAPAIDRIRQLVADDGPIEVVRGTANIGRPALLWIELTVPQIRGLWNSSRPIEPADPRYVPGMGESLNKIADLIEGA
jgi:hypothetical protein